MSSVGRSSAAETYTTLSTSKASAKKDQSDDAQRFLALLVAQYQNQDPLSPMDNAQTTSQMAQISSVTQLTKMNSTLELLIARGNQADGLAAMPFVGKAITMRTDRLNVVGGKVEGKLELASDVVEARIDILDHNGALVKTVDLGEQKAGVVDFSAEMGLKSEGKAFYLRVTTESKTGKPVAAQTLTRATLDKVAIYPDGTLLTLSNGLELPLEHLQSVADR